jgi:hypothetical protein
METRAPDDFERHYRAAGIYTHACDGETQASQVFCREGGEGQCA